MPKPQKQMKRPHDVNQWARQMVQESTGQSDGTSTESPVPLQVNVAPTASQISVYMAQIGAKGGKIGGKRRLVTMTARERRKFAKRAAKARWGKPKTSTKRTR
jgi:hypothetical protein